MTEPVGQVDQRPQPAPHDRLERCCVAGDHLGHIRLVLLGTHVFFRRLDLFTVARVALFASQRPATRNATDDDLLQSYRARQDGVDMNPNLAMFLSFGAVALFSFLSVGAWVAGRAEERKAFYRSETLKKLADSGPAAIAEYLREEEKAEERRKAEHRMREAEGNRFVGQILIVVALAFGIALHQIVHGLPVYLFALLPAGIGLVFLGNSMFARRS